MANPRQPIDSEREDLTKNRVEDTPGQEASPLELDDEDLDMDDTYEDEEDFDY